MAVEPTFGLFWFKTLTQADVFTPVLWCAAPLTPPSSALRSPPFLIILARSHTVMQMTAQPHLYTVTKMCGARGGRSRGLAL